MHARRGQIARQQQLAPCVGHADVHAGNGRQGADLALGGAVRQVFSRLNPQKPSTQTGNIFELKIVTALSTGWSMSSMMTTKPWNTKITSN